MTNNSRSEAGLGIFTVLIFGPILLVVLYTAYHVLPFYYYYYELQNQMEAVIRVGSTESDDEIRKKLAYHIRHMEIPVGDDKELQDSLKIVREANTMKIALPYEEVFYIRWQGKDYEIWRFHFYANAWGRY